MRLRITVTLLTLVAALVSRDPRLAPLLLANSCVGAAYMVLEREALRNKGTAMVGFGRGRLGWAANCAVNVASHALLPAYALSRMSAAKPTSLAALLVMEAAGLLLLDVPNLYPTKRGGWEGVFPYVAAHAAAWVAFSL